MTTPLVTVFIPCCNYGRYLGDAIASALAQTVSDLEIIVVNDGSTDNTRDVVAGFTDPRIRYIEHDTNRGLLYTLTEGYGAARGQFVARLDADDRYRPSFLASVLPVFEQHPEVGLVYGDIAAMDLDGRILEEPWSGIGSRAAHGGKDAIGDEFLAQLEDNVIPAAAVIARRECWQQALPFPDWFTYHAPSDWYLNLGVARHAVVAYKAEVFADYRLHPLNMHRQHAPGPSEERTVRGVLDEMMRGDDRAEAKRRIRGRLHARAALRAGDSYLGAGLQRDALRCYLRALRFQPSLATRPDVLRHLVGALIGRSLYDRIKGRYLSGERASG